MTVCPYIVQYTSNTSPNTGLTLSFIISDSLVKLWDAKSGKAAATIHAHKNQVGCLKWNQNGNWLASGCRGQQLKVFDIRTLKELDNFRGHQKEITSLSWHPRHETLLTSGGFDGTIMYWIAGRGCDDDENDGDDVNNTKTTSRQQHTESTGPCAEIRGGHEAAVWSLAWHPAGHILCSGSNDNTSKFWCRNRPGEAPRDTSVRTGPAALAEQALIEAQALVQEQQRQTQRVQHQQRRPGGMGPPPAGFPGFGPGQQRPPPPAPPPGAPRHVPPPAPPPGRPMPPPGAPPGVPTGLPQGPSGVPQGPPALPPGLGPAAKRQRKGPPGL